jgi:hypothetical protein
MTSHLQLPLSPYPCVDPEGVDGCSLDSHRDLAESLRSASRHVEEIRRLQREVADLRETVSFYEMNYFGEAPQQP